MIDILLPDVQSDNDIQDANAPPPLVQGLALNQPYYIDGPEDRRQVHDNGRGHLYVQNDNKRIERKCYIHHPDPILHDFIVSLPQHERPNESLYAIAEQNTKKYN